jgi:preprotein translocase subunit YajC
MHHSGHAVLALIGFKYFTPWLIVVLVFIGAMAFLVVPQLNRTNAHDKFLKTLKVGDCVVTNGGLIGVLTQVEGDILQISFSNAEPIPILRSAIERALT